MKVYVVETYGNSVEAVFDSFEKANKYLVEEYELIMRDEYSDAYGYVDTMNAPDPIAWVTICEVE